MSKGKRYEQEPKLNIKKVIAVIIAIAVIIMFIMEFKTLITNEKSENKTTVTSYYPVYTNNKWGVIDQTGEIVIEPEYDEMITIPDKKTDLFISLYDINYKTGTYKTKVIDSKNNEKFTEYDLVEVIENKTENNILWYEEGVLRVKKDNKYGLIDYTGKIILPIEYDSIQALQGIKNSITIKKENKIGLCDNKGNIIIEPEYKEIQGIKQDYKNGYIVITEDNKYGLIDFTSNIILEPKYEKVEPIVSNSLYVIKENSKQKIINKQGETVLENKFKEIKQINEDEIIFKADNNKYGVMNKEGEILLNAEYGDLNFAFNGYYIAKKSDKYGVVSFNNDTMIPFQYINISYSEETGIFQADKEDTELTDIYNKQFEKKLEGIISQINTERGYIRIRIEDQYQYYNFNLEEKKPQEILTQNTLFLDKKSGKYGYTDKDGNVVIDYIYEDATEQNEYGFAAVKKDGKWGSIDSSGKIVADNKYDLENNIIIDFIGKWHISEDINSYYYTNE